MFIAFFPQLVAGPIVRAREFFIDLYAWRAARRFRAGESRYVIAQMFTQAPPQNALLVPRWVLYLTAIALAIALTGERWDLDERISRAPGWVYGAVIVILLFTVELLGVTGKHVPFIYFQF